MPVCARCEGELIGILAALIGIWFMKPPYWLMGIMMLPMIADGLFQGLTKYESTNWRRLVTGFMFGFGIAMILMMFAIAVFKYGFTIGIEVNN